MLIGIIFKPFLGIPLIAWGGIFTFLCLMTTATIGYLTIHGIKKINFKWHFRMALLTIIAGFLHGLIAILAFLGV